MEILVINLNKYEGVIDLLVEDIYSIKKDLIIVNGNKCDYYNINEKIDAKIIYVGFSPLSEIDLNGICSLLSYVNGSKEYVISFLDNNDFLQTKEINYLISSFINYFKSRVTDSIIYYTLEIRDNILLNYLYMPKIAQDIKPYFDYNAMIYSLYKTSFGFCDYKDMEKDIYVALRNKTIFEHFNTEICSKYKYEPEFNKINYCIGKYVFYVKSKNIDALFFYVAMFLNISSFNKGRQEYSLAYLYLQRVVETVLIYKYLNDGVIVINDSGGYCFKGETEEIRGAGILIKEYFSKNQSRFAKKIKKLNSLRNKLLLSHGYYIPSGMDFDDLYTSVKSFASSIMNLQEYNDALDSLKPICKDKIKSKLREVLSCS